MFNFYSKDTVKKHKITKEERKFLKKLQKEMNTQNHDCQEDPRFWVVAGLKKQYTAREFADNSELWCEDKLIASSLTEAIDYVQETIDEENSYNEQHNIEIRYVLDNSNECNPTHYRLTKLNNGGIIDEWNITNFETLVKAMEESKLSHKNTYNVAYYCDVHYIYPDTMFLTKESCMEHINLNKTHYDKNVHSYAMTAWRSPQVSTLFKILQEVDWNDPIAI